MIYKLSQAAIEKIIEISITTGRQSSCSFYVAKEMAKERVNNQLSLSLDATSEEDFNKKAFSKKITI